MATIIYNGRHRGWCKDWPNDWEELFEYNRKHREGVKASSITTIFFSINTSQLLYTKDFPSRKWMGPKRKTGSTVVLLSEMARVASVGTEHCASTWKISCLWRASGSVEAGRLGQGTSLSRALVTTSRRQEEGPLVFFSTVVHMILIGVTVKGVDTLSLSKDYIFGLFSMTQAQSAFGWWKTLLAPFEMLLNSGTNNN